MTIFGMARADRERWQSARTLADLGELTALWLEGLLRSRPGYRPGRGPADETTGLVPVLATACRAGYMTTASQPALPMDADGGEQRAAVHGLAGPRMALRIADAALEAGLDVVVTPPGLRPGPGGAVAVTRYRGRPVTWLGVVPGRVLSDWHAGWGMCHPDAVAALRGGWQVTVADPEWGRPDVLWRAMCAAALAPAGGAR